MKIQRREFLAGMAAMAPLADGLLAVPKTAPVMRVGILTDTHIGDNRQSCSRVEMAYRLFRVRNVDLVCHLGDIADYHFRNGYHCYRQIVNETYAGVKRPEELFVFAGHDVLRFAGPGTHFPDGRLLEAYQAVRRELEIPNQPVDVVDFRGYKFVLVPEYINNKYGNFTSAQYEKLVADACAASPGKPVFVLDHEPPQGTIYNSFAWGRAASRKICDQYPQVVSLSGHVHGSLHNDVNIWQGNFTAINAGCLQNWAGVTTGCESISKPSFDVLTMDVYADRLVLRRYDVRDQSEIDAEHPWVVPLPFQAASAPYNWPRRRERELPPKFAASARLTATPKGKPFTGFMLEFPELKGAMQYRIEAQRRRAGKWSTFVWMESFSDYWKSPKERPDLQHFFLREAYFEPDGDYRITVAPITQYGRVGEPIAVEVQTPSDFAPRKLLYAAKGKDVIFEHVNWELTRTRLQPDAQGFYGPFKSEPQAIVLPDNLFAGEPNSRFRLTLDMRTIQPDEGTVWDLKFQDPTTWRHCTARTATPHGDSGLERYVMELRKTNLTPKDTYHVYFNWPSQGRVRFESLKVEKL